MSSGRSRRKGRPPGFLAATAQNARIESVLRCLPPGAGEIGSAELLARLGEVEGFSRASAIRWLKEAEKAIPLTVRKDGKRRFYSFPVTGFMEAVGAKLQVRASYIGFLDTAPELWQKYTNSEEDMRLFWAQSCSALILATEHLLKAAQSVSFAQVDQRVQPGADIARRQADVFVEVFLRRWVRELVAALHQFLGVERLKNTTTPRKPNRMLGAPSAVTGFDAGWRPFIELASKTWIESRTQGPWMKWVKAQEAAEQARLKETAEH